MIRPEMLERYKVLAINAAINVSVTHVFPVQMTSRQMVDTAPANMSPTQSAAIMECKCRNCYRDAAIVVIGMS